MITKPQFKSNVYKNGLYLVATPIGNLKDISFRSLEVLEKSDYILCEDTRVSKNLLDKYKIKSKLISNHKFNEKKNTLKIIEYLKSGKLISLISDAGTPGISDPGLILVNECIKNNLNIFSIPGPSAVTTAVAASGFSDKFLFFGFLPEKKNQIDDELNNLSNFDHSLVFFSSSKKINKIVPGLKKHFPGRKIVFCREISNYCSVLIDEAYNDLTDKPNSSTMIPLIKEGKNIIVTRTFSKIHGLAGLRIGYMIAKPEIISEVMKFGFIGNWTTNKAGVAAAIASYNDEIFLSHSKSMINEGKDMVMEAIKKNGLSALPSKANFIFVNLDSLNADQFKKSMAKRNIIISGIFRNHKNWSRVSMGKIADLQKYINALPEVLEEIS